MTTSLSATAAPIVGVRFLNARPLLGGLEAGIPAPFPYRLATAEPAACAEAVGNGAAVAGVVPVAALPHLPGVTALPRLGIACRHEVTSVLLVTRVAPEKVRTLAAHTASRTSVTLARLLLAERWGARPEVVPARPPLAAMLAAADAAVLIGDPALAVHGRSGHVEIDLAGAWVGWTGLPFVFAVWGVRDEAPAGIGALLDASLAHSEAHWEELVPRWAAAHGFAVEHTRGYLGRTLGYRLGDAEHAGMEEFLARAAAAGLLPRRAGVWRAG